MRWRTVDSPVGPLRLGAEGAHLRHITFAGTATRTDDSTVTMPGDIIAGTVDDAPAHLQAERARIRAERAHLQAERAHLQGEPAPDPGSLEDAVLAEAAHQLEQYFSGEREEFELPVAPRGSEFQRHVWTALREVPYGTTVSYGELADRLGLPPGSARSVGLALGANPIVIVLPCHRVIGADGTLTGFGGGIARKEKLLALEGSALL